MNETEIALLSTVVKTSSSTIFDRIASSKIQRSNEETITELSELINLVISEREEIYRIAKQQEEKLYSSTISDIEIKYILDNLLPILEKYMGESNELEEVKTILSPEMINILQLIGFDIKKALGEPLTELVSSFIMSKMPNQEKETLILKDNLLFKELLLNDETRPYAIKVFNLN